MRKTSILFSLLIACATLPLFAAAADISITGANTKISLSEIVGTPTMITVVLKDSNARDTNLKLLEVQPDRIIVLAPNGDAIPYMRDSIQEIEIQGGVVEQKRSVLLEAKMLRPEHQRVVERAWMRVREIFNDSADNQSIKIQAATLLALDENVEAHNYLRQLAESNDIETQLRASVALYLAGDVVSDTLLNHALDGGNRNARVMAARISGLTENNAAVPLLRVMFNDRAVQLSAPAARALARLGVTEIEPQLINMLFELHQEKGKAAIFGLSLLSDPQVVDQLKFRLQDADGMARFRLAETLFRIGDPAGLQELKDLSHQYPTLLPEAALLLAPSGDWESTQFLQNRLLRREDPTEENLTYRARNAKALLESGDSSAMAVFQELLRSDNDNITNLIFELMADLGQTRMITLLQPSIENVDSEFALNACNTVIALAFPEFRTRFLQYRQEFGSSD